MFVIVGMIIVIASVVTGYMASHGEMMALWQPFEVLIICGSALGAFMVANPWHLQKRILKLLPQAFLGSRHNERYYMGLMALMYTLFFRSRQEGFLAIEDHIEAPYESELKHNNGLILVSFKTSKTSWKLIWIASNKTFSELDFNNSKRISSLLSKRFSIN